MSVKFAGNAEVSRRRRGVGVDAESLLRPVHSQATGAVAPVLERAA